MRRTRSRRHNPSFHRNGRHASCRPARTHRTSHRRSRTRRNCRRRSVSRTRHRPVAAPAACNPARRRSRPVCTNRPRTWSWSHRSPSKRDHSRRSARRPGARSSCKGHRRHNRAWDGCTRPPRQCRCSRTGRRLHPRRRWTQPSRPVRRRTARRRRPRMQRRAVNRSRWYTPPTRAPGPRARARSRIVGGRRRSRPPLRARRISLLWDPRPR